MYIKKVLIINGPPQSGKDTLIDLLEQDDRYQVIRTSIIDPIKEITNFMKIDMSGKTDKDRRLWSDLMEITKEYNEYAFNKTIEYVHDSLNCFIPQNNKSLLVTIVARSPDDIENFRTFFKSFTKVTTILMERNGCTIPNNDGDMGIYDYKYDMIIENNNEIKDLQETVKEIDWIEI